MVDLDRGSRMRGDKLSHVRSRCWIRIGVMPELRRLEFPPTRWEDGKLRLLFSRGLSGWFLFCFGGFRLFSLPTCFMFNADYQRGRFWQGRSEGWCFPRIHFYGFVLAGVEINIFVWLVNLGSTA
jgi:hypothetical protein